MIEKYCNGGPSKIGHTTPVDDYPQGVSPYGIWDMSGNVWEWTEGANWLGVGVYVLRGGSWHSDRNDVRSTNRYRDAPSVAYGYVGFRCARSLL